MEHCSDFTGFHFALKMAGTMLHVSAAMDSEEFFPLIVLRNLTDRRQMTGDSRKTKIVCTLGPATATSKQIRDLIEAGMDVARLNFSHGDHKSHRETIRIIRQLSKEIGRQIGILQDLQGPKIRVGKLGKGEQVLLNGQKVAMVAGETANPDTIPIQYPYLLEDVREGDHILLADGTIEIVLEKKARNQLVGRVLVGGTIQSHKGVNLPSTVLRIPSFTEKDRRDLAFGLEEKVDFVALSFIRHEKDLDPVLQVLNKQEYLPLLIAKIEKPQAIERLEEILELVDGVMVARGDLGVEMPMAEVPLAQKRIIHTARKAGKPVITATQMLRSMVENPRPTRAEASDVANAILDGTDALMLSEETAMGQFPIDAVEVLNEIALATEPSIEKQSFLEEPFSGTLPASAAAISRAACWLASDLKAAAIVASTSSGSTARLLARFRPSQPIVALTHKLSTQRQLALSRGVYPELVELFKNTDEMFAIARSSIIENGLARAGDIIVVTAGIPVGMEGRTNLVKVMEI